MMAQTTEYFNEDYKTLDNLLQTAQEQGAKRVGVIEAAWQESPLGPVYQATAEVETADGRVCRRMGRARPGDSRAPYPPAAAVDDQVEVRAEARAVRAAIRTAYPTAEEAAATQPPYIVRVQAMLANAAKRMGVPRDQLAAVVHDTWHVASVKDLTPSQADEAVAWLEPMVTSEES